MFKLHGIEFGWKAIKDLWQQECARREKGNPSMVPKLRESHVLRDSWTKLNVAPAKIMQVYVTAYGKSGHMGPTHNYGYGRFSVSGSNLPKSRFGHN